MSHEVLDDDDDFSGNLSGGSSGGVPLGDDSQEDVSTKGKSALGRFGSYFNKATGNNTRKDSKPDSKESKKSSAEPISIFGAPLVRAVQWSQIDPNVELPAIVYQAIQFLNKRGLDEEGIYRVPGSVSRVNALKQMYHTGQKLTPDEMGLDPHNIAGLLKLYFRELPEPLLTRDLAPEFNQALNIQDDAERLRVINALLLRLPIQNQTVLNWLFNHLIRVADNAILTKMGIPNLGVVFSPCLDLPPLLFKIFMQDIETLFPDPFLNEHPRKSTNPAKMIAPPRPVRTSSLIASSRTSFLAKKTPTDSDWDDISSSVDDFGSPVSPASPPRVSPSPASISASAAAVAPPKSPNLATKKNVPTPTPIPPKPARTQVENLVKQKGSRADSSENLMSDASLAEKLKDLDSLVDGMDDF